MNDDNILKPEDYVEPSCLLCGEPYGVTPEVRAVPQHRIIDKMNEYMSRRDYAGAERHLLYWLEEAKMGFDLRGQLMLRNELVGHYRKTGERDKAMHNAEEALRLLDVMDFEGTISAGTTYINTATAMNAFGENEQALALFEKARTVYESASHVDPSLLGGLYNNMGLTYASLGRYQEAYEVYDKAMEIMAEVPDGELEQAITCLNRADAIEAEKGTENAENEIFALVDRAYDLLKNATPADMGYYAFVLEKCAPSFSYYGYFMAAEEFSRKAEEIYART